MCEHSQLVEAHGLVHRVTCTKDSHADTTHQDGTWEWEDDKDVRV